MSFKKVNCYSFEVNKFFSEKKTVIFYSLLHSNVYFNPVPLNIAEFFSLMKLYILSKFALKYFNYFENIYEWNSNRIKTLREIF